MHKVLNYDYPVIEYQPYVNNHPEGKPTRISRERGPAFFQKGLRSVLIHRVAVVVDYLWEEHGLPNHAIAHLLCNVHGCIGEKHPDCGLLMDVPKDGIVCMRCEGKANEMGLPTAAALLGRPVTVGRMRSYKTKDRGVMTVLQKP